MIPTFILINQLHMVNTIWAILIPGAFNVWNMILARTYYQSIPKELREASAIDGATEIQHFSRLCFRYANRLSQYWHCGHLLECGTATLMR